MCVCACVCVYVAVMCVYARVFVCISVKSSHVNILFFDGTLDKQIAAWQYNCHNSIFANFEILEHMFYHARRNG